MIFDFEEIEKRIGYEFKKDKMLLRQCFTHSSYAHDTGYADNERLEFFGDAILDFIVTEYLCKTNKSSEGALTKLRSEIVSKPPLQDAIYRMGLDDFLLFGRSYNKSIERGDEKLFSSLYEALVAGIYIDGGIDAVRTFIVKTLIEPTIKSRKKNAKKQKDSKSALQEYVQKNKLGQISYKELSQKGPAHAPTFKVAVCLDGKQQNIGVGSSKKEAEMQAAEQLLNRLKPCGEKQKAKQKQLLSKAKQSKKPQESAVKPIKKVKKTQK